MVARSEAVIKTVKRGKMHPSRPTPERKSLVIRAAAKLISAPASYRMVSARGGGGLSGWALCRWTK